MAGAITVTATDLGGGVTKYAVAWTATAGGAVSGNTFDLRRGRILGVKFISGSPAPTTGYALTLLDADSLDLLVGAGATVASPAASYAAVQKNSIPVFCEGATVTPTVASAGNAAQGTLVLYIGP